MNICGVNLSFNTNGFQLIYSAVACFMWIVSLLFSIEYMKHYEHKARYYIFMIATWFATVGVFLSADFLTTFIFFEIMSFTSYLLVIHEETPGPMRAGETYLAVAVIGGMVMLMGLFLLYDAVGILKVSELSAACEDALATGRTTEGRLFAAGILILFGFGAKAGMVPLHIWLPKAHPVAPAPASALLSGILTKAGIFGAIIISVNIFAANSTWGVMMASIGMVTMLLGAVLGVFSTNLKRTLACSSVSQIGFITLGIGMLVLLGEENALASNGTFLHMLNHSMIKLLLFSCAGVIYMNLHKLDLNEIRGFGRSKPLLLIYFLIGAASISGIPGTSGYISKTLLHESIVEYIELAAEEGLPYGTLFGIYEWVFLFTGGLTFCYMTKLFVCIFVERNSDSEVQGKYNAIKQPMNVLSAICLGAAALVLAVLGMTPYRTMNGLATIARPFLHGHVAEHAVHYFTWTNIKGSCISLAIGLILYFCLVRRVFMKHHPLPDDVDSKRFKGKESEYLNLWPEKLDLEDLVYRPLIKLLLSPGIFGILDKLPERFFMFVYEKILPAIFGFFDRIPDACAKIINVKIFRQWNRKSVRFSIKRWYNESGAGKALQALHAGYLDARDSLSFGLLLAVAALSFILLYLLLN